MAQRLVATHPCRRPYRVAGDADSTGFTRARCLFGCSATCVICTTCSFRCFPSSWSGPSVFAVLDYWSGGRWSDLGLGWSIYLTVCAVGAIGLMGSSTWQGLRPAAKALLWNHSTTVDIARRLGHRPIGDGPFRYLAQVPGNEAFRIEVSEKALQLPRLPQAWDGLSVLHLTDLHFIGTLDRPFFDQVMELSQELEPDLIVMTGDLIDDERFIEWLPDTLGRLQAPLGRFFVLGNHEWHLEPEPTREALMALGWCNTAGLTHTIEHKGHSLVLAGTERPWMGDHPDLSPIPAEAFRLLLSHTPDNLHWARQQQVDLMLSGHNHGGQVVLPLIGPVYSPSIHGCRYSSGAFDEAPTVMYVSRGISGRHPLRWRCLPELTKLVLKAPPPNDPQ